MVIVVVDTAAAASKRHRIIAVEGSLVSSAVAVAVADSRVPSGHGWSGLCVTSRIPTNTKSIVARFNHRN